MLYLNHFCIIIAEWFFPAQPPCHIEAMTKTFKLLFVKPKPKKALKQNTRNDDQNPLNKNNIADGLTTHTDLLLQPLDIWLVMFLLNQAPGSTMCEEENASSRSNPPRRSFRRQWLEKCPCTQRKATASYNGLHRACERALSPSETPLNLVCTPASAAHIWDSGF